MLLNKGNSMVAIAIVVAGALIAAALYFALGNGAANPSTGDPAADQQALQKQLEDNFRAPTASEHVRGNLDTAEVIIVEYSDLECPACQYFHPIMNETVDNYNGKVAWVFRHFPLVSIHPKAQVEAEGAECAAELGGNDAFWKFVDRVYEVTPGNNGLDLSTLPDIAEYAGVDRAAFSACLESGKYTDVVKAAYADAVSLGAGGTPFSVIITTKDGALTPIEGSPNDTATMAAFIDGLLAQ